MTDTSEPKKSPERRSLTRLILPFSFSNYFRGKEVQIPKAESGIAKQFPFYALIADKLEKNASWEPLDSGKLKDFESMMLPHIVRMFRGTETELPEISVFCLNDEIRKARFGEFLFMLKEQFFETARKKKTGLSPQDGFFCLLSDIRIVLSSTGVGMIQADLHLCDTGDSDEPGCTESFRNKLLEFVSLAQYMVSDIRKGQSPIFVNQSSAVLFSPDPSLLSVQRSCFKSLLAEFGNSAAEDFGSRKQAFFGASELSEIQEQAWNHVLGEVKRQANALGNPFIKKEDGGISAIQDAIRKAETRGWVENPIKKDPLKDHVQGLRAAMLENCRDWLKTFPEWLEKKRSPESLCPGSVWRYTGLVSQVFGEMGIQWQPPDENDAKAEWNPGMLFLNGDRMFVFSHVLLDQGDNIEDHRELGIRLSRRQGLSHDLCAFGEKDFYRSYQTVECALSLEGLAILQGHGINPEFTKNSAIYRERHYVLVLMSLIYRFNLLNIEFQSTVRVKAGAGEIAAIDKLNARVDHFTHNLYYSHVSNFTHYQEMFDALLQRMNVHHLWQDAGRDVCQYLERRKLVLEQQQQRRRKNLKLVLLPIGGLVIASDIANLLYHLNIKDKILDMAGGRGEILLIPLIILLIIACAWVHCFIERREKIEEESAD